MKANTHRPPISGEAALNNTQNTKPHRQKPVNIRSFRKSMAYAAPAYETEGDTLEPTSPTQDQYISQPCVDRSSLKALREIKLRGLLRRITSKFQGLIIRRGCKEATEEWQQSTTAGDVQDEGDSPWLLHHSQLANRILQLIIIAAYLIAWWHVSVELVFQAEDTPGWMAAVWLIAATTDIILSLNTVRRTKGKSLKTRRAILLEYLKSEVYLDVVVVGYCIYCCFQPVCWQVDIGMDLAMLAATFVKLSRKSSLLRTYFSFKNYLVLADSLFLLLVAAHLNVLLVLAQAMLLFLSSKFSQQTNWLIHIGIQNASWTTQYVYSAYWAVTTIVTVGYGDITPQNEAEVVVTMFVQVMGSALFGYLINVIGVTMAELKQDTNQQRKQKETLQQELGIAERMVKYLSLDEDLAYRLKGFLEDNQKADSHFSLGDEKRIWDKLKPDLRQSTLHNDAGILQQTNIRVIKKCLFFLTHFSRNMQDAVALRLVKRVFQPNERLGVDTDRQSLFIIDQGKVDLQVTRSHFNKQIHKTLRVINKESSKELGIRRNLFGFTAIILRRRVNLTALSREFVVAYELQQNDFDELVGELPVDFENMCQLRDEILAMKLPEACQGPELLDNSSHFVPLHRLVVHKANRACLQPRKHSMSRRNNRLSSQYPLLDDPIEEDIFTDEVDSKSRSNHHDVGLSNNNLKCLSTREGSARNLVVAMPVETGSQNREVPNFDQAKSYSKYFVKGNYDRMLKRINAEADSHQVFRRSTGERRNAMVLKTRED